MKHSEKNAENKGYKLIMPIKSKKQNDRSPSTCLVILYVNGLPTIQSKAANEIILKIPFLVCIMLQVCMFWGLTRKPTDTVFPREDYTILRIPHKFEREQGGVQECLEEREKLYIFCIPKVKVI